MKLRLPHLSLLPGWIKGSTASPPCRPAQEIVLSDAPVCIGRGEIEGRSVEGFGRGLAVKLFLGGVIFFLLTVGVFIYQFGRIQSSHQPLGWHQLQWKYLLLIILCFPLDALACGLRIWVVSRVLDRNLSLWTCLKAELANLGVGMLTPSQTGGGFGQVYILYRSGANPGTAFTISVVTFMGTILGMLLTGLYILLVPGMSYTGPVLRGALWTFTLISGCVALGAAWPDLFVRLILGISNAARRGGHKANRAHTAKRFVPSEARPGTGGPNRWSDGMIRFVYGYHRDLCRFLRAGWKHFFCVFFLSLAFMASRALMAFLCLRFLGIHDGSLREILELQLALIFLVYFAPTPGSSGLAEGVSLSMMGGIVPVAAAPYYNLLWRSLTLYLPATVGLLLLGRTMARDARRLVSR